VTVAELVYYPDTASRIYDRPVRRSYDTVGEAMREAEALPSTATIVDVRYDNGTSVPTEYRAVTDRNRDRDQVIYHRWAADGWDAFRPAVVSTDGAQTFTTSVSGHRGRVTGPNSGSATSNRRSLYLRDGTCWPDSEIESTWWGPSVFTDAGVSPVNRPQLGHVHGAYVGEDGRLRAAVVWYNIFGGPNPEAVILNTWESDGTSLFQGNDGVTGGSVSMVGRSGTVIHGNRFVFGGTFTDLRVTPPWIGEALPAGAVGDIAGMAQAGLNGTDMVVQEGIPGLVRVASTGAALTDATAGGTWTPDYPWRVFPYRVRSRWRPPVLEVKQWGYGRPEPDWGSAYVWTGSPTQGPQQLDVVRGDGFAGIAVGHCHSGSYVEVGDLRIGRVGSLPAAA
jgi:hypothetical protein